MATLKSDYAKGVKPMPVAQGAEVLSVRMEISLAAALAAGDILYMGDLPEDHVPVDCEVDTDDLDTGATPAIVLQAGVLNADATDLDVAGSGGGSWIGNSTVGQAGGLARASDKFVKRVAPSATTKKKVGIKVSTGPATGATSGKVGLTLHYRAAHYAQ